MFPCEIVDLQPLWIFINVFLVNLVWGLTCFITKSQICHVLHALRKEMHILCKQCLIWATKCKLFAHFASFTSNLLILMSNSQVEYCHRSMIAASLWSHTEAFCLNKMQLTYNFFCTNICTNISLIQWWDFMERLGLQSWTFHLLLDCSTAESACGY